MRPTRRRRSRWRASRSPTASDTTACTPHIYPGLYENDAAGIKSRVSALQRGLFDEGIALKLTLGADAHLTPELLGRLKAGTAPSLAGGRYFLLEPPQRLRRRGFPNRCSISSPRATCRC